MRSWSVLRAERIIGVDPGLQTTGVGIVAGGETGRPEALYIGTIRPGRKLSTAEKLLAIVQGIRELIQTHKPNCLAVEETFYHKNVKAALALGQARGAALLAAAEAGIDVVELSPKTVKQSAVGTGGAAKSQVATMVTAILQLPEKPASEDATDALAIALAALHRQHLPEEMHR